MACTIVTTPALGASDWSSFITQVEYMRRGFMAMSLTNFSGTAASTVAAGSMIEIAGSLYNFTDTAITLATATASADTSVYFVAIPSAGGTTCTIQMDSTAPTWVDAKQGFYASAASVSRVFGGCYIGTAATYFTKYLYTPEHTEYCRRCSTTRPMLHAILPIGEWNMDATSSLYVYLNTGRSSAVNQIASISVTIRDDTGANRYDIGYSPVSGSAVAGNFSIQGAGDRVLLARYTGGGFDSAAFDGTVSTVATRGYVVISYEA